MKCETETCGPIVKVSAALICREGKFLICRRPMHKARGGLWEFVGGKAEAGETEEEALKRECMEELGIEVRVKGEYMRLTHAYPDLTVELALFRAEIAAGEPQLLEHIALKWISPEEIGGYDFCPADEAILEKIAREGLS